MPSLSLNGLPLSTSSGKTYVLYKVIHFNSGEQPPNSIPIVEGNDSFLSMTFAPTDLIFAINKNDNIKIEAGVSWMDLGHIDKNDNWSKDPIYNKAKGRSIRMPSWTASNWGNPQIIWFCYKLIENSDKATVPPLLNVYNSDGSINFSSKRPLLNFSRFIMLPDSDIIKTGQSSNSTTAWRGFYDINSEMILLNNMFGYTPNNLIYCGVTAGFNSKGVIWLGVSSSFSANMQRNKFSNEVYQNLIMIAKRPPKEEWSLVDNYHLIS